jgi:N-acetylneuraminate synthase
MVGLSDHTLGVSVAIAAVALGAVAIEKHVTLRRADGGVDSTFSLEPDELAQLVKDAHAISRAMSGPNFVPKKSERDALNYRRTLYVVEDVRKGEPFTIRNVRAIRPGYGIYPKYLSKVLGRIARRDIKRGEPLGFDMIDGPSVALENPVGSSAFSAKSDHTRIE